MNQTEEEKNRDIELVSKVVEGDEQALRLLIDTYAPPVYRFLSRLINDRAVADDLTQETFIKVWKNISRFNKNKTLRPWIFRIARNSAFDFLRKKRSTPFSRLTESEFFWVDSLAYDKEPTEVAIHTENAKRIHELLRLLSEKDREILIMHYLDELSGREISEIIDLPYETIKTRLRRARIAFRKIAKNENEPSCEGDNVYISND